jgi:eukaryotic-like serine/threonine-protein kinase
VQLSPFQLEADTEVRFEGAPRDPRTLFALAPPNPEALFFGTPYVAVKRLGEGGMGEVYEVEHLELGRRFAAKVLHHRHRYRIDLASRLREEARALGQIRHRNLVDVVHLAETTDERPYFVAELLRGRDLRCELARARVMAVPVALRLMAQALDGLAAAHAAGLVHCDVKAENLFLCDDGTLKVIDFGIAGLVRSSTPAAGSGVVGTTRTMAPEQWSGERIDPRTDLYAAGLVLFELVTGRGPFDELRGQPHALRYAHAERLPPRPSQVGPQAVPAAVEEAILRALAKAPRDRFQSAAEMARTLRALANAGSD